MLAKAPGPDGIPAKAYKGLVGLIPLSTALYPGRVEERVILGALLEAEKVTSGKPKKGRRLRGSKKPISLICTVMKAVETVVYDRVIHTVEPSLRSGQFA